MPIAQRGARKRGRRAPLPFALLALALTAACGGGSGDRPAVSTPIRFPAPEVPRGGRTLSLEGSVWGSGRTAVVFAHAFPETQGSWAPFAAEVAGKGFLALTFNFRGYGLSEGSRDPARADLDLDAAVAEARRLGATAVEVVGASMGGTAALKVAARRPLAGVVAVSAPLRFRGLDAIRDAARVRSPVLLVAAADDPNRAAESARALSGRVRGPKRVEIVPGTRAHGTDLLGDDATGRRVRSLITSFLVEHRG